MTTPDDSPRDARGSGATAAASVRPAPDDHIAEALDDVPAIQVFDALAKGAGRTASELADVVGARVPDVEERLQRLVRWNLVEAVNAPGEADEVSYRTTRDALITDEVWAELSVRTRRGLTAIALDAFDDRIQASLEAGGFDGDDSHVSWLQNDLDRRGYEDMVRLGAETLERARDIQAEVADRRAGGRSEGEAIRTNLVLLHFEHGEAPPAKAPEEADALREEVYDLVDEVAAEVPEEQPNWRAVAVRGRELVRLALRLG